MKSSNQKLVDVSTGDTVTLNINSNTENYALTGVRLLNSNFQIVASELPTSTVVVNIWSFAAFSISGTPTFTILGQQINLSLLGSEFYAMCIYVNDKWVVTAMPFVPNVGGPMISINHTTGTMTITPNSITANEISTDAGIPRSALVLDGGVSNSDLAGGISRSKLSITGTLIDADLASGAAIALSKLAALAFNKMIATDGAGHIIVLDTAGYPSLAELAFIKGLTSAIQTQLAARIIAGAGAIVDADVSGIAGIAHTKLAALAFNKLIATDGAGKIIVLDTATYPSLAELALLKGNTQTISSLAARVGAGGTYQKSASASISLGGKDFYKLNSTSNAIAAALPNPASYPDGSGISVMQVFSAGATRVTVSPSVGTLEGTTGADVASFVYVSTGEVHVYISNGIDKWSMFS